MFGIDDAIAAVANVGKAAIDKIWPDANDVEKAKAERLLAEVQGELNNQLAQIRVNEVEAANPSVFVSGWRPFVGWTCGSGFIYEFVLRPIVNGALVAFGLPPAFPGIEVEALNTLLFGLLGLGAARTVEKVRGVARHR